MGSAQLGGDGKGSAMATKTTSSASPEGEAIEATTSAAPDAPEMEAEITPEQRNEMASRLVGRFAAWAGIAGFIPLPLVDAVAVGGLQVQMLRRLSQIYDKRFTENAGKALIASLAGSLIPETSAIGAASMLKAMPVVGTIAAGFVMPALSAGATYAIGKAFVQHFSSGGTLLDFNPPDYREFIKAQKEMWESGSARKARSSEGSQSAASTDGEATATSS
jgi:uncharacterized protein (DUF697 family)